MYAKDLEMALTNAGVDIDELNTGPRTFEYMLEEINGKDVRPYVFKRRPEQRPGPTWVFGLLRDTVTIVAEIGRSDAREIILERHRIYPDGSKGQRKGFQTISETRKIGEEFELTVQRAFREELRLEISRKWICTPTPMDLLILERLGVDGLDYRMIEKWSSVYKGVWSTACIHPFVVRLPKRPWAENTKDIDDCGVTIRLQYIKKEKEVLPEFLTKKVRALDP